VQASPARASKSASNHDRPVSVISGLTFSVTFGKEPCVTVGGGASSKPSLCESKDTAIV
jgi:hypothetical protein